MATSLPHIDDDVVQKLVSDMNLTGFACIASYVSPDLLARMRDFVNSAVEGSGRQYVAFTGREATSESVFDLVGRSEDFQKLMQRLYEIGTGLPGPKVEFHQVLRCLVGTSAKQHSFRFHYDSYVVTALVPVEIPTSGKTGDLIMLPNWRRIRGTYLANAVDKVILDNPVTQKLLKSLLARRWLPVTRLHLVPGNIYFFWGYRSIHTNEDCDSDKVRATALFHYANPHAKRLPFWKKQRDPALTTVALEP